MKANFVMEPEVPCDTSLVELSLAGDREAFGQIVARYQSPICALAYSACGNVARSEDLAQEIFITAWRRLGSLQEPARFKAWLYGIARNLINNAFRQRRRNPVASAESLEDATATASPADEPDEQAISKEEEAILWRVLSGLPEIYREPMVLFYRQNESVAQVAGVLAISEEAVRQRLSHIIGDAKGRVLISCFATSMHRLQIVTDLAHEFGRKICFVGRSMFKNSEIAMQMGKLNVPPGMLVSPQDLRKLPRNQVAVVIAGSQGEPMSAMARVAVASHRWVTVEPGDEVVLSARVIPGNEKAIFRMLDHLYRRGAVVHYHDGSQPPVHVSGHGSAEELKLMLNIVRPKYFVPIHGEYRQLWRHVELAKELAAVSQETFLLETGDVLEFDEQGARRAGRVTIGRICIDGGTLDEVEEIILKERRHISEDGIVIPILAINEHTGVLETQPEIVSRGFVPLEEASHLMESAREVIMRTIEKSNLEEVADWGMIKEKIRTALRRHFNEETGKRPMILPVILEV